MTVVTPDDDAADGSSPPPSAGDVGGAPPESTPTPTTATPTAAAAAAATVPTPTSAAAAMAAIEGAVGEEAAATDAASSAGGGEGGGSSIAVGGGRQSIEDELNRLRERGNVKTQRGKYKSTDTASLMTPEEARTYLAAQRALRKSKAAPAPPTNLASADLNSWFVQQKKREAEERRRRIEAEAILRGYKGHYFAKDGGGDAGKRVGMGGLVSPADIDDSTIDGRGFFRDAEEAASAAGGTVLPLLPPLPQCLGGGVIASAASFDDGRAMAAATAAGEENAIAAVVSEVEPPDDEPEEGEAEANRGGEGDCEGEGNGAPNDAAEADAATEAEVDAGDDAGSGTEAGGGGAACPDALSRDAEDEDSTKLSAGEVAATTDGQTPAAEAGADENGDKAAGGSGQEAAALAEAEVSTVEGKDSDMEKEGEADAAAAAMAAGDIEDEEEVATPARSSRDEDGNDGTDTDGGEEEGAAGAAAAAAAAADGDSVDGSATESTGVPNRERGSEGETTAPAHDESRGKDDEGDEVDVAAPVDAKEETGEEGAQSGGMRKEVLVDADASCTDQSPQLSSAEVPEEEDEGGEEKKVEDEDLDKSKGGGRDSSEKKEEVKSMFDDSPNFISSREGARYPPKKGRYHLIASYACPWSHRTLIVHALKGLGDVVSVSAVHPIWQHTRPDDVEDGHRGWVFSSGNAGVGEGEGEGEEEVWRNTAGLGGPFPSDYGGNGPDPIMGARSVRDLCGAAEKNSDDGSGGNGAVGGGGGKFTVPILWDKKTSTIVSSESVAIMRMLNSSFNQYASNPALDLYPLHDVDKRDAIDDANSWIYPAFNSGVYRCSFATTQRSYDDAISDVAEAFDRIVSILRKQRYIAGDDFTEADVRLFVTLLRFDEVYSVYCKANVRSVAANPLVLGYCRRIYRMRGVRDTCRMDQIKAHYYCSHVELNRYSIVPRGMDFMGLLEQEGQYYGIVGPGGVHVKNNVVSGQQVEGIVAGDGVVVDS